jgi:hypothetical protein
LRAFKTQQNYDCGLFTKIGFPPPDNFTLHGQRFIYICRSDASESFLYLAIHKKKKNKKKNYKHLSLVTLKVINLAKSKNFVVQLQKKQFQNFSKMSKIFPKISILSFDVDIIWSFQRSDFRLFVSCLSRCCGVGSSDVSATPLL